MLVDAGAEKNTEAAEILTSDIYVDDLFGGGESEESVEDQIQGSHSILSPGGFCLKYVAKSREKNPDKASSDGISMKVLGYKWEPEKDTSSPGIGKFNLNWKIRGSKKIMSSQ